MDKLLAFITLIGGNYLIILAGIGSILAGIVMIINVFLPNSQPASFFKQLADFFEKISNKPKA